MTVKETRFVSNVVEGHSQSEAARRAGYSDQVARKGAYQILQRPLVRTALTEALEQQGLTLDKIVKPVVDAMGAKKYVCVGPQRYEQVDDHAIRLDAHDRAVALLGGVAKVGEATPTAVGLNLIINIPHLNQPPIVSRIGASQNPETDDRDAPKLAACRYT